MIAIRTDGPMFWSVYAPSMYDPQREERYFGPDTLDACVEAARTLKSVMPAPEVVTRYCVSCDCTIHVHPDSDAAWGLVRCDDCIAYAQRCDEVIA